MQRHDWDYQRYGSEIGAFLSIEQSILPQTITNAKKQTILYAIYNMAGTFAMSAGVLLSGMPEFLKVYGFSETESIKVLFIFYSIMGLVIVFIYIRLSEKVELKLKDPSNKNILKPMTRTLSNSSKEIITKLSALFAIDSFAGGFVIQSVVSFWFFTKFNADLTTLSYIFSVAGILTAFSFLAAAKISIKIGLINTIIFTHIPSNILIILVALSPSLPLAIIFYLCRMTLSQMDVYLRDNLISLR